MKGEVTALETRYVIQCEKEDDGEWYDFGLFLTPEAARTEINRVRNSRDGHYRIVRRKTEDVILM